MFYFWFGSQQPSDLGKLCSSLGLIFFSNNQKELVKASPHFLPVQPFDHGPPSNSLVMLTLSILPRVMVLTVYANFISYFAKIFILKGWQFQATIATHLKVCKYWNNSTLIFRFYLESLNPFILRSLLLRWLCAYLNSKWSLR